MKKTYASIFALLLFLASPAVVLADVLITEVAWMGTSESANDEWIELFNAGSSAVSLEGWSLVAEDGSPIITLAGQILANGYYILERTDDGSEPSVTADLFYSGSLSNAGEKLLLKNAGGTVIDTADGKDSWAIGGNNETKETLQRTSSGWTTAPKTAGAGGVAVPSTSTTPTNTTSTTQTTNSPKVSFAPVNAPTYGTPNMAVYAGEDRHVTAGADSVFKGEGVGSDEEPLKESAVRWRWNFGDGTVTHGKRVTHTFAYPGIYVVELSVSNEAMFESVSDRLIVTARPALVTIAESNGQYIELKNSDSVELDISRWLLSDGTRVFSIPEGTYILPSMSVRFPSSVTKLGGGSNTSLLYPNTMLATKTTTTSAPQSLPAPVSNTMTTQISQTQSVPIRITKPVSVQKASEVIEDNALVQHADAILAVDPLAAAAVASATSSNSLYKWLLALFGIIAIAGVILFIHDGHKDTDEHPITDADKYTIVT